MFVWPHGIFVDSENNVWVTDARGGEGIGHQIHKFSEDGELLMSLGVAGVGGDGETIFNAPSDVLIAPDGSIFVADGTGPAGITASSSWRRTARSSRPGEKLDRQQASSGIPTPWPWIPRGGSS